MKIAIILPVYNEAGAIYKNFNKLHDILIHDGIVAEYMLVDDGSKDDSWKEILQICSENPMAKAIKFSRNFGKEKALMAGVESIFADIYVTMDSDLQHPPTEIKPMIDLLISSGVSIVNGVKSDRGKEKKSSRFFAKSFYRVLEKFSGMKLDNSSDFKVMRREVIEEISKLSESNVFFRGLIDWIGFSSANYHFQVSERELGTTSFSLKSLFTMAFSTIFSFTSKPLFMILYSGIAFFIFAVLLGIQTLYNFFSGHAISGFSTVILLVLLSSSLIMIALAIIGIYLSRIYDEVKARPTYIIETKINMK